MTKADVVRSLGEERYREACRLAWQESADRRFGRGGHPEPTAGPDLADEIADLLWYSELPRSKALDHLFEVYDEMPDYGHLMVLTHVYAELSPEERSRLHRFYRGRLALEERALREPVEYSLWCDFFENPETVTEWWHALAEPGSPEPVLRRVLPISGPVPWNLKVPVYENLLPAERWHEAIFESLVGSAFDYFGKIDRDEARRILGRLRLPADHPGLRELAEKLL